MRTVSNYGHMCPFTLELPAFEHFSVELPALNCEGGGEEACTLWACWLSDV